MTARKTGLATLTVPWLASHCDHHACSGGPGSVSTDRDQPGRAGSWISSESWTESAATTTSRVRSLSLYDGTQSPRVFLS